MRTEGAETLGAEHTKPYTGGALGNCTLGAYIMLLTMPPNKFNF